MEKKILMVVAPKDFRDEEYIEPRKIFEHEAGMRVSVASSRKGDCLGIHRTRIHADFSLSEIHPADYDAIVFVGGPGTVELFHEPHALELARDFFQMGKVTAAICIAPSILGYAGILEAKRVTAYPSQTNHLQSVGADFTGAEVEVDGNIITAIGPEAAHEFGEAVARALR